MLVSRRYSGPTGLGAGICGRLLWSAPEGAAVAGCVALGICWAWASAGCTFPLTTTSNTAVADCKSFNLTRPSQHFCLLYTSDAADDLLCVDLGGRRIIKKK